MPGADLFGVGARLELSGRLPELPEHSREAVEQELATLDFLEAQIESAERWLVAIMGERRGGPAEDIALRRQDPQHGLNAGNRQSRSIPDTSASGQLRGSGAARTFERWSHQDGSSLWQRKPEPEVGFRGNRKSCGC